MNKVIFRSLLVLVVLGAAYGGYRYFDHMPQKQVPVPTAKVRRSDVIVRAFSRGELRAVRSVSLTAPNLFSTVQVTRLAPLGSLAKEKDLIVEFDDSERRTALEETLLEVEQIDEQIKKAKADLAIRNNQDQVELLKARYSVRRAELEVKRNELISEIDAKKNVLNLEESRRRLKQLESDIKSRQEQALAELAVLQEKRNKSMIDVGREKQRIAQSKILSPITGLVSIRQNRGGFAGSFGQQVPDIREGDTLQPGAPVADVLDLSEMEIIAKVGELDRANLREGQEVKFVLDAIPDKTFHGKIKGMSGTATANPFGGDPAKKFDVLFSVDMKEFMTGLGAKPEEIQRVLETAARNAKKAPTQSLSFSAAGPGGPGGPGGMPGAPGGAPGAPAAMPGAAPGAPGGQDGAAEAGGRQRGGRGGPGGAGISDEQRAAMFARMMEQLPPAVKKEIEKEMGGKKMQDLSAEQRNKIFTKLREASQGSAGGPGGGGPGRQRGGPGGPGGPGGGPPVISMTIGGFTEADRENAKLPLPPEEDSQLEVLLRPGLLADVEIIVDKVADALNVPTQAVFEKDGKQFVYVLNAADNRFEQRVIKLAKRSESVMVIAEGVKASEVVALGDPTAKKNGKNDKSGSPKSLGMPSAGAAPGGKGK
jgi:HlyD family secretion protein